MTICLHYTMRMVIMITMSTIPFLVFAANVDKEFRAAIQYGAIAGLSVHVVDEDGHPVNEAKVDARFDSAMIAAGEVKTFSTDTNGVAVITGRTGKSISVHVSKVGYYDSRDELCYVSMGHGVKNGRWLPWNMKKTIALRSVKNPKAEQHKIRGYKYTKRIGEWLKFDLEYGDFVSPQGQGKIGDFDVRFNWNGKVGNEYTGMSVEIRFKDKYSGGCLINKVMCSDFKGAYVFPVSKQLRQEFTYFAREKRNPKTGDFIKREENKFDETKVLTVRSRCEVDPTTGRLLKCHYSQISNIIFGCGPDGIVFLVKSTFNPTPNDTNLEPKQ